MELRLKLHAEVFRPGSVPAARRPPEGSSMAASVLASSRQRVARQHKEIVLNKTNSQTFLKVKNSIYILYKIQKFVYEHLENVETVINHRNNPKYIECF